MADHREDWELVDLLKEIWWLRLLGLLLVFKLVLLLLLLLLFVLLKVWLFILKDSWLNERLLWIELVEAGDEACWDDWLEEGDEGSDESVVVDDEGSSRWLFAGDDESDEEPDDSDEPVVADEGVEGWVGRVRGDDEADPLALPLPDAGLRAALGAAGEGPMSRAVAWGIEMGGDGRTSAGLGCGCWGRWGKDWGRCCWRCWARCCCLLCSILSCWCLCWRW